MVARLADVWPVQPGAVVQFGFSQNLPELEEVLAQLVPVQSDPCLLLVAVGFCRRHSVSPTYSGTCSRPLTRPLFYFCTLSVAIYTVINTSSCTECNEMGSVQLNLHIVLSKRFQAGRKIHNVDQSVSEIVRLTVPQFPGHGVLSGFTELQQALCIAAVPGVPSRPKQSIEPKDEV